MVAVEGTAEDTGVIKGTAPTAGVVVEGTLACSNCRYCLLTLATMYRGRGRGF